MNALLQRILMSLLLLLVVCIASFALLRLLPGDVAEILLMHQMDGEAPTPEAIEAFRRANGLDASLPVQFLRWLNSTLHGDLGTSFRTGDNVSRELALRIPNTLLLGAAAMVISLGLSFPSGISAMLRPGSWMDRFLMGMAVISMAMPGFWLALIAVLLFSVHLGWLPVSGYASWLHLVLPSAIIGLAMAGASARLVRNTLVEVMQENYIRTAFASGLPLNRIILRHALPNALVPILTFLGLQLTKMFDSVVIIETVFGWPGIGRLFVEAILSRDFPVIQGCVLVIGIVYVGINFAVDMAVAWVDPRIRGGE